MDNEPATLSDFVTQGLANLRGGISGAASEVAAAFGIGKTAETTTATAASAAQQQADVDKAHIDEVAKAKEQGDDAASSALLGNSPGAASRIIAALGQRNADKVIDIANRQDEIEKMKGQSFLDDPLQWFENKFTLPKKESVLEQEQSDLDKTQGNINKLQTITSDAYKTNAAQDTVDAASAENVAVEKAGADALDRLRQSQDKLFSMGMQAAQLGASTSVEMFSATLGFNSADMAVKHLNLEYANQDISLTYKKVQEALLQDRDLKLKDENAQRADFESKLPAAAAVLGLPGLKDKVQFDKLSQGKKDIILQVIANRDVLGIAAGDTNNTAIDPSPAAALQKLESLGSQGFTPGQMQLVQKLNEYKNSAAITIQNGHAVPDPIFNAPGTKPEVKLAMEDAAIKFHVQQEFKNIPEIGGIYSPAPLTSVLNSDPIVAALPQAKLLAVAAKNAQYPTKPDDFAAAAQLAISKGSTPAIEAAQTVAIFKAAAMQNDIRNQYGREAIPTMSDKQFNMTVHTQGLLGASKPQVVDWLNLSQVRDFYTRQAIAAKVQSGAYKPEGNLFGNPSGQLVPAKKGQ